MICVATIFTMVACQEEIEQTSASDLLTSKEWKLAAHGVDSNGSNSLEENENLIEDCQEDNTYLFHSNGLGHYSDNDLSCGNESSTDFNWKFLDSNTSLQISYERFSIIKLTEHELVLRHGSPTVTNTFLTYIH